VKERGKSPEITGKNDMPAAKFIAIFAGTPAEAAYLADIVRLSGFSPAEEGEKADLTLVTAKGGAPSGQDGQIIRIGGGAEEGVRVIKTPLRACQLIEIIEKNVKLYNELPSKILISDCTLDTRENLWQKGDEKPIRLTEKETAILAYLKAASGQPVTREKLLEHVWSYVPDVETHTLETHIYRLRQKIEQDASNPKIIITQGDGYVLVS
jgi:DNA-binding winged helix-turn-helix (wHTH) protein